MTTRAHPVPSAAASDGVVADSAGQFDRDVEPRRQCSAASSAVGPAAERGVQVDQVNPLRPGPLPGQRGVQRVAVARLGPGRALHQPDRLAAGHVHGGQQGQAAVRLRHHGPTRASWPAAPPRRQPDFSGWNWVAHSGPSSTAAMKSSPVRGQADQRRASSGPDGGRRQRPWPRRSARSRTWCPGRSRPAAGDPAGGVGPCSSPCAAGPGPPAAPRRPASTPQPAVRWPCSTPVGEQHLHADADAEHRPAAGQPLPMTGSPRTPAARPCTAANAPTPGHHQARPRSAPRRHPRSPRRRRPTRCSARWAERRLPEP